MVEVDVRLEASGIVSLCERWAEKGEEGSGKVGAGHIFRETEGTEVVR